MASVSLVSSVPNPLNVDRRTGDQTLQAMRVHETGLARIKDAVEQYIKDRNKFLEYSLKMCQNITVYHLTENRWYTCDEVNNKGFFRSDSRLTSNPVLAQQICYLNMMSSLAAGLVGQRSGDDHKLVEEYLKQKLCGGSIFLHSLVNGEGIDRLEDYLEEIKKPPYTSTEEQKVAEEVRLLQQKMKRLESSLDDASRWCRWYDDQAVIVSEEEKRRQHRNSAAEQNEKATSLRRQIIECRTKLNELSPERREELLQEELSAKQKEAEKIEQKGRIFAELSKDVDNFDKLTEANQKPMYWLLLDKIEAFQKQDADEGVKLRKALVSKKPKMVEEDYNCPVGMSRMTDPVIVLPAGKIYDRVAIETWQRQKNTDPLTRVLIESVVPLCSLKAELEGNGEQVGVAQPVQQPPQAPALVQARPLQVPAPVQAQPAQHRPQPNEPPVPKASFLEAAGAVFYNLGSLLIKLGQRLLSWGWGRG